MDRELDSIAAATAAKLLQSCPNLCNPIDDSPPGFPVPGILQARTLEWVAISFSNAWKWKVKVKSLSCVRLYRPHGLQPTRLLRPWDSPGKNPGVGCHYLLQRVALYCMALSFIELDKAVVHVISLVSCLKPSHPFLNSVCICLKLSHLSPAALSCEASFMGLRLFSLFDCTHCEARFLPSWYLYLQRALHMRDAGESCLCTHKWQFSGMHPSLLAWVNSNHY